MHGYVCDVTVKIPEEAVRAHDAYIEEKRWFAHGCFDPETGIVRKNGCIHFGSGELQPWPCPDDPGTFNYTQNIGMYIYTIVMYVYILHNILAVLINILIVIYHETNLIITL